MPMMGPVPYLLDTGVVLITTRQGNPAADVIEQQFGLRASSFRPAICEVSVAELLAFATAWGAPRRKLLDDVLDELLVLPITARKLHEEWAKLRSFAKEHGLAIQHDHNDLWIAATANLAGMTVITCDAAGFKPIRDAGLVKAELVDTRSGKLIP